jgi:putative toxin-antitoxin system antitoxin component (TIGR02293 family)
MEKNKQNIVASISKKTGASEEETSKIITEFAKELKKTDNNEQITVLPGIGYVIVVPNDQGSISGSIKTMQIPNANQWYIANKENFPTIGVVMSQGPVFQHCVSARQHIIEELKSNRKSKEILEKFMKISGISNKLLAEEVFEISPKTLYLYRKSNKDMPIRFNEQILKLEELYKKGIELFEDSEGFNKWLKSESYGLGNVKPIDLINSITGIDLIFEELVRIEFGATA